MIKNNLKRIKIKNKKLMFVVLIVFIALIILLFLQKRYALITNIINLKASIEDKFSYKVLDFDGEEGTLLIKVSDESGIDQIITPSNLIINAHGKNEVSFDYKVSLDNNYLVKVKNNKNEEYQKEINVSNDFLSDFMRVSSIKESEYQRVFKIEGDEGHKSIYYAIGNDTENWTMYSKPIRLDYFQIKEQEKENEDGTVTVRIKEINDLNKEVITSKKITDINVNNANYNTQEKTIVGTSLIDCIKNNNLENGNYLFKITGMTDDGTEETINYPVELYNYNEDATYITNNNFVVGTTAISGFGNSSTDNRTLVLKYNGNLTIESDGIMTANTKNSTVYKKGMFIYCANKITNNGQISMTARGTNTLDSASTENVYLYKNADETFEYVPGDGAKGGSASTVTGASSIAGGKGSNATGRQTGGGGGGTARGDYKEYNSSLIREKSVGSWEVIPIYEVSTYSATSTSKEGHNGNSYAGGYGGEYCVASIRLAEKWIEGSKISPNNATRLWKVYYVDGVDMNYGELNKATGGLLMIYSHDIENNSKISSQGRADGYSSNPNGASGSGSINIFFDNEYSDNGSITADSVGNGGAGSVTIGTFEDDQFVNIKNRPVYLYQTEEPTSNFYEDLTGGYSSNHDINGSVNMNAVDEDNNGYIELKSASTANSQVAITTNKKIDLTNYSKLVFLINVEDCNNSTEAGYMGGIQDTQITSLDKLNIDLSTGKMTDTGFTQIEADLSDKTGEYFIGFQANQCNVGIYGIWLVPNNE